MKSLTNRFLMPFGFGMFAIALMVTAILVQSPPSLAIDGVLTDCRVRGIITGGPSPNPAIFSELEVVVTQLSAEYDQPKAAAECIITGPTWSWSIQNVERQAPRTTTWNAHRYRPTLQHPNPNAPDATLRATFPQPGSWRVKLKVTGTWSSTNCLGCAPDPSATVVVETTVSPCSFTGVLEPEDDFMGRSYSRVGLAEVGSLSVRAAAGVDLATLTPLTWRVMSGSEFMTLTDSGAGDGTATFVARPTPGRAVLEVSSTRVLCRATLTVDIIEPNRVYHEYDADSPLSGIAGGLVSYGVLDFVYFEPKDVSFKGLGVGEGLAPVSECTGAFIAQGTGPHPANGVYAMTVGNRLKGSRWAVRDQVYSGQVAVDGDAGRFVWVIPQQYFRDGNRINIPNSDLNHVVAFDGMRTIRIQKGGVDRSGPP